MSNKPSASSALSPRPFTVNLKVPEVFAWERLVDPITSGLQNNGFGLDDPALPNLISQYSHLLRIASWEKGIDWTPTSNQITLVVPNDLRQHQKMNRKAGHYVDGLSVLLTEIIESISLNELLSFFLIEE